MSPVKTSHRQLVPFGNDFSNYLEKKTDENTIFLQTALVKFIL